MSSRALRKMQKQKEMLQQLDTPEENESEEEEASKPQPLNAFDMLVSTGQTDDDEAGSSDHDDTHAETPENNPTSSPPTSTKKNKARKKKKKGKVTKAEPKAKKLADNKGDLDEIDLALKSSNTEPKDGSNEQLSGITEETYPEVCRLLGVDTKQLNALNEMKRLFGNVVLEGDSEGSVTPGHGRRRGRGPQQLDLGGALAGRNSPASNGQGLAGLALRRNVFMAGKEEWPKATGGGLGMEIVKIRPNGVTEYRFVHNSFYQDVQSQFVSCVDSMEPQRLIRMLRHNPYHISTLLQVSEIAKQQGDHSVSGDLLERSLFSFGRSVHSSFAAALSEGKVRLDFRRPENREFWLAAWRYIINLGQRGTWRTAYEWAKLLLSLDPEGDPFCVVLILDQLALRAGQSAHFLKLRNSSLYHLLWSFRPNIRISSVLAEYKTKLVQKAAENLKEAVATYPWIFARLFQELNIDRIPKSIWGREPRSSREKFDCEMYIQGSKDLWNTPQTISLLVEAADSATAGKSEPVFENPITLNEARHVFLSGAPALLSLVPREFTSMPATSSDPLPPEDNNQSYTIVSRPQRYEDFRGIFDEFDGLDDLDNLPDNFPRMLDDVADSPPGDEADAHDLRGLQSLFSRLIPWVAAREGPEATPQEIGLVTSDSETGREHFGASRESIMDLLRRTLNRDIIPSHFLHRGSEDEIPAAAASNQEPSNLSAPTNNSTPSTRPSSPLPPVVDAYPAADPTPEEPYDDERNQRWLAGQGIVRLRDFTAAHGVDDSAWSPPEIAAEGREAVREYARRVLLLRQSRTRNFIIDYALRQGTSAEVKALVLREVERLRVG